jgi:poly(A) polymerase
MLEHPRFRAGYDFLALRAESGEAPGELAEWWRRFQDGTPEARSELLLAAPGGAEARKRRRRRRGGAKPQDAGPPPVLAD